MRGPITLIPIALVVALAAGCGGGGGGSSALASNDIVVVGKTHISKAQYDALMEQARTNYKQNGRKFPKQGTTQFQALKAQAVSLLVQQAERVEKAKSMGIDPSSSDVDARMKQIKQQYFGGSDQKYQAGLKKQHLTDAQVRQDVLYQLVSEDVSKKLSKGVKVSNGDVQDYYNAHKAVYTQPASRDVRYILVKSKTTADQVYTQLSHGNEQTWCKLAKKYAKDASGQSCGKATFSKGQTVPIFDRTAFSAPANKVHVPFYDKTQYKSWFIIEPLGPVKAAAATPLKTVQTTIRQTLEQQKTNKAMGDWISSLKTAFCSGSRIKYALGYTASPDPCAATTTAATTG
jgi:hypothetical protein